MNYFKEKVSGYAKHQKSNLKDLYNHYSCWTFAWLVCKILHALVYILLTSIREMMIILTFMGLSVKKGNIVADVVQTLYIPVI